MKDAGRIGFVVRGEYDSSATYEFLDVVLFGNSSYVAKKSTTGNEPEENNEYWQMLAKAPDSVVTGVKGKDETLFRTGDVNITPENIGLGNVNNTADAKKNVASAGKLTTSRNITVGNTSRAFNGTENISFSFTDIGILSGTTAPTSSIGTDNNIYIQY